MKKQSEKEEFLIWNCLKQLHLKKQMWSSTLLKSEYLYEEEFE